MDKIIRCITSDGAIMAACVDASDIVFTAKKIHHLSRSATAALGRLLCATSIMGDMLKQKDASVNLRVMGDGELGPVIAVVALRQQRQPVVRHVHRRCVVTRSAKRKIRRSTPRQRPKRGRALNRAEERYYIYCRHGRSA